MFDLIKSGKRKFEVRIEDDCKFKEGDTLILKECDKDKNVTGRKLKKKIDFVLRTKDFSFWTKEKIDRYGFTILGLD